MRKKLYTVAAAALLLCALGFTQSNRPAWEYKFEHAPSEKKANELGGQGWELVAIQSTGPNIIVPTYVFRRQK